MSSRRMATHDTTTSDLAAYLQKAAPEAVLNVIANCAQDRSAHWRNFLALGFASRIAGESALQRAFFRGLWDEEAPYPHAAPILAAFLDGLTAEDRRCFLGAESLRDKNHPAGRIFHGASFCTPNGERFLALLEPLVRAGLRKEVLREFIDKFHRRRDLVRATLAGHDAFVRMIVSNLDSIPLTYLHELVEDEQQGPAAVGLLVNGCGVRVATLLNPEVARRASRASYDYLNALRARGIR